MKTPISFVAVCLAALCASVVNANESTFSIDIFSSNKVCFENLSVEYQDGTPVFVGRVKRSVYNSKVLPGHVDYIVKDEEDHVIVEGGIQYSPSLSLRQWKYGSSFSIALPKSLPDGVIIQAGFHRNAYSSPAYIPSAAHAVNKLI